ncbi:MAG TPA: hypothetical protein VFH17_06275 [Coriobacteriia bacterium]|nr:hypothetical protein [Coriobacteriia bacterium]
MLGFRSSPVLVRRAVILLLAPLSAGVRGSTLIVNLPGSEKAARESFGFIAGQLEHAVEMMSGGGH